VIADDEEHLAAFLKERLAALWPELEIAGLAAHGEAALALIESAGADIAFLDIKMPGLSGLDVAARLTDSACRIVFVTAYDQFALEAFEHHAVDYLVKPITDDRLGKTIERLRREDATRRDPAELRSLLSQVAGLIGQRAAGPQSLRWIRAQVKDAVRQIPVEDILFFRAADKYTIVELREPHSDGELLIRLSLSELLAELDTAVFWQIHRSTIVNLQHVLGTRRDVLGKTYVQLKGRSTELPVSRQYAARFKQM
jgi:DNA-binding LytR/AlgR family response regulator